MRVRIKMLTVLNTILIVITIPLIIMLSYACIHCIRNLTVNDKEPNTLTIVDENQNSLHRKSSDDTIIIRTNTTIEL
jgi:hypothetical protein